MFAVRGITVCLAIFFTLYAPLSFAVCLLWRKVWLYGQQSSARRCANLLFILRLAPFLIATAVTLALAVPSFLFLEPRTVEESIGAPSIILCLCALAAILGGIWKAVKALLLASRAIARWSRDVRGAGFKVIDCAQSVSVMRISSPVPPLTAAGILRPRVWLSSAAEFMLTGRELQCALRHEVAHVRRRDNLKKLVLRLVAFPGMVELESAWREAAEMAADDAAVSTASEALDLAAALIKLSRLVPLAAPVQLATSLVHSPAESVNARVERLIAWTAQPHKPAARYSWTYSLCAAATVLATLAVTYHQLLVRVHEATEWLVR